MCFSFAASHRPRPRRPRPKDPAGKHAPQYEVITVVRPVSLCKKPALAVSVGDLNGLYDVPEVR